MKQFFSLNLLAISAIYSCTNSNNETNQTKQNKPSSEKASCNSSDKYYLRSWDGKYLLNSNFTFSEKGKKAEICLDTNKNNTFLVLNEKYFGINKENKNIITSINKTDISNVTININKDGSSTLVSNNNFFFSTNGKNLVINKDKNDFKNVFYLIQSNKKAIIANNRSYYIKKNDKYIATKAHSTSFYLTNSKNDDSIFCFHNSHSHFRISSAVDAAFITAASDLTVGKVNSAAGWENFHALKLENGDYAFKTFHNNFLALNPKGELVQFDSLDINNSGFTLEDVNIIQNSTIGDYKNFGRFGNQIYQYLFLKVYALKHGLEVRTRPWDGNFFYNLNDSKPLLHLPIVSDMGWSPSDYDENLTKSYNDSSIAPFNSNDIRGYFLFHNSQHKNNKEFIRSLFKVDSNIENDFNKSLVTMRNGNKKILAIHIRRDDGVQTPLQLYVDFVNNNYDKLGKPVIYLASDGLKQVLNELNTNFPTFLTTYKVFTENDFIPSLNPDYLKGKDLARYASLISELGLRR